MSYEYLAASLPPLELGRKSLLAWGDFVASCETFLPAPAAAAIRGLADPKEEGPFHPVRGEWQARETQLRNAVARARASTRRVNPDAHLRDHAGFDGWLEESASEAMGLENPLERETALDRLRWRLAGDLAGGDPFGIRAVYGYALRLRLCERWEALTREAGEKRLEALVDGNLQSFEHGNAA